MQLLKTTSKTISTALTTVDKTVNVVNKSLDPITDITLDVFDIIQNTTSQMRDEAVIDGYQYRKKRTKNMSKEDQVAITTLLAR